MSEVAWRVDEDMEEKVETGNLIRMVQYRCTLRKTYTNVLLLPLKKEVLAVVYDGEMYHGIHRKSS